MFGNGYFLKAKSFYGYHESLQSNGGLKQSPPWKRASTTKKLFVQVEQEDVKINGVYWQKIDTQKGVVDYLQSLIESGKSTY